MKIQERRQKGLYWDKAWTLVNGCSKVSKACEIVGGRLLDGQIYDDYPDVIKDII